jgi:hypothetical protein
MEVVQLHPLTAAEQARKPGRFLAALLEGELKPAVVGTPAGNPLALASVWSPAAFLKRSRAPGRVHAPGTAMPPSA